MLIKQFSNIISGYTFRGSIIEDKNGDLPVLQAKDITTGEYISDLSPLTKISSSKIKKAIFLKNNDVMIASRGRGLGSFKASVFKNDKQNVIPSSSLLIIRIKNKEMLPDFVVAYLNSKNGQSSILKNVTSGVFQTLLKKNLADINIPAPSLEKQKLIADLGQNIYLQQVLISRLLNIKKSLFNRALISVGTI